MPIHNTDIARIFEQIAELLEIQEANPFRIRAYRNAARNVQELGRDLTGLVDQGADLTKLAGIGKELAAKIEEIVHTGRCQALQKLQRELPAGLTDLLQIPGLGPKRVHALYSELDVHTPEQLLRAARDGRLEQVPGFGPKTRQSILDNLQAHLQRHRRLKLAEAAQYAQPLATYLGKQRGVDEVIIAGSYRRHKETVGDLDLLVCARDSAPVMQAFADYDEVARVVSQGSKRSTVTLHSELQVDLRVVPRESLGAAPHYFTGSKAHNIALRLRARQRGLKINE
jgi:DNA polymerase (family 10)